MGRRGTGIIAAVVLVAVGPAFGSVPAEAAPGQPAEPGEPTIVVEQAQPLLAGYDYTLRVAGADGVAVNGAEVTGTPVGPDGSIGRITTLAPLDEDGRYRGIVEMPGPGTWTVRFAVADPVANLEHVQAIALPGQAAPSDTPAVTEPAVAEEPPPADDGPDATDNVPAEQPADDAAADADAEDDGGSNAVPTLLAVGAALAILAFGTAVVVTRRHRDADAAALDAVQREDPLHAIDDDKGDDDGDEDDKDDDSAEPSDLARQ